MTRRRRAIVAAFLGFTLAFGVAGGVINTLDDRAEVEPEPTPSPDPLEAPSFAGIPEAVGYMNGRGLGCSRIVEKKPPQTSLFAFGSCQMEDGGEIDIYLFDSPRNRDQWKASILGAGLEVLVGPNWLITPNDRSRARALQEAIGGELEAAPAQ